MQELAAQSFEPPSTAMTSPVIQRDAPDARNSTTDATSSGWPMRLSDCIPITVARTRIAEAVKTLEPIGRVLDVMRVPKSPPQALIELVAVDDDFLRMDSLHGVEANGEVAGVFDIDNKFALAV